MIDVINYQNDIPAIGYCLSRRMWGQGLMTEACKRLITYLFDIGFKEIMIKAVEENIGSNRVIQKCGFQYVGKETKEHSKLKPQIVTINEYKLLKENFIVN